MDAASHHESRDDLHSSQLRLLDRPAAPDWRLDDTTREVGRRGIAAARAALRTARRRSLLDDGDGHRGHPTAA